MVIVTMDWRSVRILTCLKIIIFAQNIQQADCTAGGRLFALAFPNITTSNQVFEEIFVSSFQKTTLFQVSIPQLNYSKVFALNSTNQWSQYIPFADLDITTPKEGPSSTVLTYPLAVIIASQNDTINVQVSKAMPNSGAGYLALPIIPKSTPLYEYFVPAYTCLDGLPTLEVVAVQNDTCIAIEQYYTGDGTTFRKLSSLTMQANDVTSLYSANTDYTGILVSSRKPVSVFGGCVCAKISNLPADCELIYEQVPEAESLGIRGNRSQPTHFVMASIEGRPLTAGFRYRIISASTGPYVNVTKVTELSFSTGSGGGPISVLDVLANASITPPLMLYKGQWQEFYASANSNYKVVVVECAGDTCEVMQYNPGFNVVSPDPSTSEPDSYMVLVPPIEHYTRDITFSTSSVSNAAGQPSAASNFMTIVAIDSVKTSLLLDSSSVTPTLKYIVNTSYVPVALVVGGRPLTPGFHTLSSSPSDPSSSAQYTAFVYGHGNTSTSIMSYGELAAYGYDDDINTQLPGPWYDMSLPNNGPYASTVPTLLATAAPLPPLSDDDLPKYRLAYTAEFKALEPDYTGKTPDFDCSNNYYRYFTHRLNQLELALAAGSTARPSVCGPNINITIKIDQQNVYYFSEYSRSEGTFAVLVQGYGTATLSDVSVCAFPALDNVIRNPFYWNVPGYSGITTFLWKNDPTFSNLSSCATLYLSNSGGLLDPGTRGWACPWGSGAVFGGAAPSARRSSLSAIWSAVVGVAFALQLVLGRRR